MAKKKTIFNLDAEIIKIKEEFNADTDEAQALEGPIIVTQGFSFNPAEGGVDAPTADGSGEVESDGEMRAITLTIISATPVIDTLIETSGPYMMSLEVSVVDSSIVDEQDFYEKYFHKLIRILEDFGWDHQRGSAYPDVENQIQLALSMQFSKLA